MNSAPNNISGALDTPLKINGTISNSNNLSGALSNSGELSGIISQLEDLNGTLSNYEDISGNLSQVEDLSGAISDIQSLSGEMSNSIVKEGDGGSLLFTTDSPINNPLGQFKNGQEVLRADKVTLNNAINKILHKDVAPSMNFSSTSSGILEIGTIIPTPIMIIDITSLGSATIKSVKFYNGSTLVNEQEYIKDKNKYTYQLETDITVNTTLKGVVEYYFKEDDILNINKSTSYTFVSASYYGIVNSLVNSVETIKGLNKTIKTSKALTYNNIAMTNKRICYTYPKNQGVLTTIKDSNNFEVISSYTRTEINIDGFDYYIYTLTDTASYNGKIIFG